MHTSFHANAFKCHILALKTHAFTYGYIFFFLYKCVTLKGQPSVKQKNLRFVGVHTFSKPLRKINVMLSFNSHKPNNKNFTFYNLFRRRPYCVVVYIPCERLVSLSRGHSWYKHIKQNVHQKRGNNTNNSVSHH